MLHDMTSSPPVPKRYLGYFESSDEVVLPHSGLTTLHLDPVTVERGRNYEKQHGAICLGLRGLNFAIAASVVEILTDALVVQAHQRVRISAPLGNLVQVENHDEDGPDARHVFSILQGLLPHVAPTLNTQFPARAERLILQCIALGAPRHELIDVLGNLVLTDEGDRRTFLCAETLQDRITLLISFLTAESDKMPANTEEISLPPDPRKPDALQSTSPREIDVDDLGETYDDDLNVEQVIKALAATLPEDRRGSVGNLLRSYDLSATEASRNQLNALESLVMYTKLSLIPPPTVVRERLEEQHRFHQHLVDALIDHVVAMNWFSAKGQTRRIPPILLLGSPGLGKTDVARVFAQAIDRTFASFSLGGVHDALAIAGSTSHFLHASPGGIVQGLIGAGALNPVFLLDEIDKMGVSNNGDPAAVLLEVLGSNDGLFTDHFLGVPINLSNVIWIATANTSETIHPALLDRMRVIEIPDYTKDQRLQIIEASLIPRALDQWSVRDEVGFTADAITHLERMTRPSSSIRTVIEKVDRSIARAVALLVEGHTAVMIDHEFVIQACGR